jgi:hypothetical protein
MMFALLLSGCGEDSGLDDADKVLENLLTGGAFSEELEELDSAIGCEYYGLNPLDFENARFFFPPLSLKAEELVYLKAKDEEAFTRAQKAAAARIAYQKMAMGDYLPAEVPKLDEALVLTDETSLVVVVVVANDYSVIDK